MINCRDENALEERLSRPTEEVLETLRDLPGEVMVLGAGGKVGPSLARMVRRAFRQTGDRRQVYAVSRFRSPGVEQGLQAEGVRTIRCDLSSQEAVLRLPDVPNILFLSGQKFGTGAHPEQTWMANAIVPARVAEALPKSRFVVFSTGCVYPLVDVRGGGSTESDRLEPPGEYAQSCVARERIFSHYSQTNGTPVLLFRLNYAIDLRYGVLVDLAQKVFRGEPVDLSTGWVNVIWQGDANARAIQCLPLAATPPAILNVTGPRHVSVRELALAFGRQFNREPVLVGTEAPVAWLSDARRSLELFGPPKIELDEMIAATAEWVAAGLPTLGRPTHFEVRDGQF